MYFFIQYHLYIILTGLKHHKKEGSILYHFFHIKYNIKYAIL